MAYKSKKLEFDIKSLFAGANISRLLLISNKVFTVWFFFLYCVAECIQNKNFNMRSKIELEYNLNCSPRVLFSRLRTPEGLSEWFADKVNVNGDLFSFYWNRSESKARLSAVKENKLVRFEWVGNPNKESNYFEFRINIEELTGGLALIITDFAEADEKEDSIYLWDNQIQDLKRLLGSN